MIVRELITRLGFATDMRGVRGAEQATQRIQERANSAAAAMRNIFLAIGGTAVVRQLVTIGDAMQSMEARIGMLPQTLGDAGAAFDTVAARASAGRTSIEAYGTLYTRIGNAARDYITTQEDLLGITDTISKALVVGGATTQEAQSAMIQFSQALGAGTLQGEEFRAMAEAAPQYLDQLSIAMGIPRAELKKMASDGKLTSKAVIEATRQMSTYFEDKFRQMPMTVGQSMSIIGNRFRTMVQRFNRESQFITNIANFIISGFGRIEAGANFLSEKFNGLGNVFRALGILIATAIGAKIIVALNAMRVAGFAAMLPFAKMILVLGLVALAIDDVYSYMQGGQSVIGDFIAWFNSGAASANLFQTALALVGAGAVALGAKMAAGFAVANAAMARTLVLMAAFAIKMAAAWLIAFWPLGVVVGLLAAVIAGVMKFDAIASGIARGYNAVKSFVTGGDTPGMAMTRSNSVGPTQLTGPGMGASKTINANTTVQLTVPPGTSADQAAFVNNAANQAFGGQTKQLAGDLAVIAR